MVGTESPWAGWAEFYGIREDEKAPMQSSSPVLPVAVNVPSSIWRNLATSNDSRKLPKGLDVLWEGAIGRANMRVPRRGIFLRTAQRVLNMEKDYTNHSDAALRDVAQKMRNTFRLGRQTKDDVLRAFAVVREVSARVMGMKHHKVQVAAAMAMHSGCVVELATGEGKTLSATMPAVIAGWRGRGCHVITVNDYLAARDAETMGPIYKFCGLSVASIDQELDPAGRRQAYNADVTYLTNKEVAADFLRDRLALGQTLDLPSALISKLADGQGRGTDRLVMRGLDTAIIDEADSILIDEAVTPLIISGEAPNPQQVDAYAQAAELAAQMSASDFKIDQRYREINLTKSGKSRIAELTQNMGGIWTGARRREELVNQALTAREMFLRDKHYVLQEDEIVIIDEFTGRLMPDRTWRHGLHQAIEAKEALEIQTPKDTLARISFQRFFRFYKHLSGMTGTAWEARNEMWQIYRMPTVTIPTNKPCIREHRRAHVYGDSDTKWAAVIDEIRTVHELGRPILVGTRSVAASEHLSNLLTKAGLEHLVLNAVRHAEEAQIVAAAGGEGKITVATNMAGRGTDIKLGRGVRELGGLHVIATELHESGRIDRQLYGRAGRQGDPGSAIAFIATDDELIKRYRPRSVGGKSRSVYTSAQQRAERMALRQRKQVLQTDDWLDEFLGFAGRER